MNREAGWYGDPYFRTQERYWDGEAWTDRTRSTTGGTTPAAKPAGSTGSAASAPSPAEPAAAPADTASAMLAATPARPASGGTTKSGTDAPRSGPGVSDPEAGRTVPLGVITAPGPSTAAPGHGGSGQRRGLLVAVVAAIVVLAAVGVFFIVSGGGGSDGSGGGGGGGGTASATGVAGAVEKTLHAGTAEAAVDVKVSTASGSALQQILSGSGGFELNSGAGTMVLDVPGVPAQEAASQLVFVGPTVYVSLGPSLSALVPGKTWVAATPAQLGASGSGLSPGISAFEQLIGNPATLVTQLHGSGVRFTSLGASTFDGTPVQGYLVKIPPSGSGTAAASPSGTTAAGAHTGERLYVSSKGYVKAIVVPVVVGTNGQNFHESINIVFTRYGHAVTVTPPPAAQVATLAQFQAASGQTSPTPGASPSAGAGAPNPSPTN